MNRAAAEALFIEDTEHLTDELLSVRKWRVFSRTFPVLDVGFEADGRKPFRVQMNAEDWNELPPGVILLSFDGSMLTSLPTGPTNIFHQGPHPSTGRPFVCMAGTREYHTHSSHTSDLWENYKTRPGYRLAEILTRIWSGWLKSTP